MLQQIIEQLDQRILHCPALTSAVFDRLVAAQRELGLVFADQPTCPFLLPHIIARSQYDEVMHAADVLPVRWKSSSIVPWMTISLISEM